jgi:resorcinol 4-hydroxylase (NADPH)
MNSVIVIGAGPVGLFTALMLGNQGIDVTVYERWPDFYPLPRACGIDHEIVRQLQAAGLGEAMKPLLDPVIGKEKTYEFVDAAGETLLRIDWNRPGASGWAQMNLFYQPDLERLFAGAVDKMPHVRICRGIELRGLCDKGDYVEVELASSEGQTFSDEAFFVVGADGANSTVRQLCQIDQTDLGFQYDWLVVDVVPHEERPWVPYVVQHCNPSRPTTSVGSGPGRRRWEFMRLPNEPIEALASTETVWRLLEPWNINAANATLERHAVYTFRACWANAWHKGRVLLAGDAAHLMPPFLAQGLCSGMRDATALAWRLPIVLSGNGSQLVLDSYGVERSAHVSEIIKQAAQIGRLICMLDPEEVRARNVQMKAALKDPALALKPPPEPRLGADGIARDDNPNAGFLAIQSVVERGGRSGLFDDIVGHGWQLLSRGDDPINALEGNARELALRLTMVTAGFGPGGNVHDIKGDYHAWFNRLGADVVLVRPDFYVFGTAETSGGADALVRDLGEKLGLTAPSRLVLASATV